MRRPRITRRFNFASLYQPIVNLTKGIAKKFLKRSLVENSGMEAEYQNPDVMLDEKGKDITFYDTMMLDPGIKEAVEFKKTLVLNVDNKVIPSSDEEIDIEKADFVQEVIDNLSINWSDTLDNTLDGMVYGFKIAEIMWNKDLVDGKWTWDKFKFMHSIMFDFHYDEWNEVDHVAIGRNFGSDVTVKVKEFKKKFICFTYPYVKDNNYYGSSDLKELYVDWWQKFNIIRWRGVYLQGFGFSIPIIKFDKAKTSTTELTDLDATFDNWQDLMRLKIPSIRNPVTGLLEPKFEIDWRDIGTAGGVDQFNNTITMIDKSYKRRMLIPDKTGFSAEKEGAKSQSEVFFDALLMVIRGLHKRLEDLYNPHIRVMVDLNYPNTEEYPKWKFDDITEKIERETLKLLTDIGVIDKREKWIRNKMNIPQITQKEQDMIDEEKEKDEIKNQEKFEREANITNGFNGNDNGNNNMPVAGNGGNNPKNNKPIDKGKKKFKAVTRNQRNLDKIKNQLDTNEADFIRDFSGIHKAQSTKIIDTIKRRKIVENKNIKELNTLKISKVKMNKLFEVYYAKLYIEGKRDALDEVVPTLKKIEKIEFKAYSFKLQDDVKFLDKDWIDSYLARHEELGDLTPDDRAYLVDLKARAFERTGRVENDILNEAFTVTDNGIRANKTVATITSELEKVLDSQRRQFALTIARTNASDAYNTGRMNAFMSPQVDPFIEAYQYNAIIDNSTTAFCSAHDGQVMQKNDPQLANITPPNHFNCRSILNAILVGEDEIPGDPFAGYKTNDKNFPEWGVDHNSDGEVFDMNVTSVRQPAVGFGGVKK